MFVQNLDGIVRKPNVTPRQFLYCTTDSIPIDLMFQEISYSHTSFSTAVKPEKFEHDSSNSLRVITKRIKNEIGQFWGSELRAASRELSMRFTRFFFCILSCITGSNNKKFKKGLVFH